MATLTPSLRAFRPLVGACALAATLGLVPGVQAQQKELKIGTTGSLAAGTSGGEEKAALETLHNFIKSETGFENEIVQERDWQALGEQMSKGKAQIGVFPGYEFAWAKEKFPKLNALTIAVNSQPYRYIYLVVGKTAKVKQAADLQGKKLTVPQAASGYPLLFVQKLAGKDPHQFFSKVNFADNVEDALDDLVDGTVDAVAVDRQGLEAFKRRKPARFARLRDLAHSEPLPPTVIAYYDRSLDDATLNQFKDGLMNANKKEKGRNLLTYFKLTGFSTPPGDFDKVLTETRKNYRPPTHESAE